LDLPEKKSDELKKQEEFIQDKELEVNKSEVVSDKIENLSSIEPNIDSLDDLDLSNV
jgi:hypothetical protein